MNASAKFRIGRLLLPKLSTDDLEVHAILDNGSVRLKPVTARIGGGTLSGRFDFIPGHGISLVAASVRIDKLDVGRMLQDLGITDMLHGRVDVNVDVAGKGTSIAALMAGLNGSTRMVMKNGRIHNKYIDLLGGNMASGIFRLANPVKEKTDHTEINCFVNFFDIKDGLAESTALVLSTDSMNVIGDGAVDLRTEKLDFSLKPLPKEGVAGVSLSLHELTRTFKLGGTLAHPLLEIDPARTAVAIGKAIGGVALFGPVGIAEILVGGKSGDENPCLAAIEAIQRGGGNAENRSPGEKGTVTRTIDGAKDSVGGLGKKLKGLFGD